MRVDEQALSERLNGLPGWSGSTGSITKQFLFADFAAAVEFINEVASIAQRRNHHPDIAISWNRVTLAITSHSEGGVTTDCLGLAQEVESL